MTREINTLRVQVQVLDKTCVLTIKLFLTNLFVVDNFISMKLHVLLADMLT